MIRYSQSYPTRRATAETRSEPSNRTSDDRVTLATAHRKLTHHVRHLSNDPRFPHNSHTIHLTRDLTNSHDLLRYHAIPTRSGAISDQSSSLFWPISMSIRFRPSTYACTHMHEHPLQAEHLCPHTCMSTRFRQSTYARTHIHEHPLQAEHLRRVSSRTTCGWLGHVGWQAGAGLEHICTYKYA